MATSSGEGKGREEDRLCAFQPSMRRLVSEIERADLRKFRTLSGDRSWQQIVARATLPIATRLTAEAHSLVVELCETCRAILSELAKSTIPPATSESTLPPAFLSFEASMDSAVRGLDSASSIQTIEDIAFLVETELRQRAERLRRLGDHSQPLAVIGECDSALRRIRKGCGAVDAAIAKVEGSVPALEFASELEDSLTVRRAYARFGAYVGGRRSGDADGLPSRLRGASARINLLAEGDVGPLLRVRDRLQILELQDRVQLWLQGTTELGHLEGERLWQDLVGFAEMLSLVNRRQELIDHDRKAVIALLGAFETFSSDRRAALLRSLTGLDPELDTILETLDHDSRHAVGRALSLVTHRLGIDERLAR